MNRDSRLTCFSDYHAIRLFFHIVIESYCLVRVSCCIVRVSYLLYLFFF